MTNQEILVSLGGDEDAFRAVLRALGWFRYPPEPSDTPYRGRAFAALDPRLRYFGKTDSASVRVYRLHLPPSANWRDAQSVVQSHLRAEPHFAIVFCVLAGGVLLVVPADPTRTTNGNSSLTVACAYMRTEKFSASDLGCVDRLRRAPNEGFRKPLQDMASAEKVTKRFYDEFDKEARKPFLEQIRGIDDTEDREWYASVMLNRIMFLFFLQEQGYMDNDLRYLPNRWVNFRGDHPVDRFHREFMLPLFHEALGSQSRTETLRHLTGDVPYLNGGIFAKHSLEEKYSESIAIPDEAYNIVFQFFGDWNWCLDDRPLRTEKEINPDVLGYIFEKYINRKQMGAYYTKEDITEYIGRNTIVPFLAEKSLENYSLRVTDFRTGKPDPARLEALKSSMLELLKGNPDDYIFDAVKKGVELPLPPEIEAGVKDVSRRGGWNRPADEEYALPTEWWRETVARRQRCEEIRALIAEKTSFEINDFITWNLNIRQWLEDFLHECRDDDYLRAFEESITECRILDPTCGSGAFLFAALNILLPLYKAVYPEADPYHTLKTIILHNLYGADIMEEAVEICKLRLFLKLAAQKSNHPEAPNHGLEPLPDMDFNILPGNALVGYATLEQLDRACAFDAKQGKLGFEDDALRRILSQAEEIREQYDHFCEEQLQADKDVMKESLQILKAELKERLGALNEELNQMLAKQYGVQPEWREAYGKWKASHKPFHWYTEFYGVMSKGGFDVIIGNPPFVSYSKVSSIYQIYGFKTLPCRNLYAFVIERSLSLLNLEARFGMIVPIASVSTDGMLELQELYENRQQYHSHFAVRPGKLFSDVDMNLTISLLHAKNGRCYVTSYRRWSSGVLSDRPFIFTTLNYTENQYSKKLANGYPKIGSHIEHYIIDHMLSFKHYIKDYTLNLGDIIFYHSGGRYWRKAFLKKLSSHYKPIIINKESSAWILAILNSQLFYWYWICNSNCMDVVSREVFEFPVFSLNEANKVEVEALNKTLLASYESTCINRQRHGNIINGEEVNFDVQKSKPIIDEIDRVLAKHYGFTEEELDFIINYDIKYRMGGEEE